MRWDQLQAHKLRTIACARDRFGAQSLVCVSQPISCMSEVLLFSHGVAAAV